MVLAECLAIGKSEPTLSRFLSINWKQQEIVFAMRTMGQIGWIYVENLLYDSYMKEISSR